MNKQKEGTMKRMLAALMAAVVLTLGGVSVAIAQDTDTDTEEVVEEATNDEGDTGLIGLAGLLGLLGLFGLKRRDDDRRVVTRDARR
jgi:MYXO-CTERM domain-containing protein